MAEPCDRCGARAKRQFTRETAELHFCGHHANKFVAALVAQGFCEADSELASVG